MPIPSRDRTPLSFFSMAASTLLLALLAVMAPPAAAAPTPFVPVISKDFPDPFILKNGTEFIAYATNPDRSPVNVQMAASADLMNWEPVKDPQKPSRLADAMPVLPAWAKHGFTWAPEVLKTDAGFVLYFTARHKKSGLQCVGAATSTDPRGPFVSNAAEPLVCQFDLGGTIDASPFRDADGSLYLYFKNDGNNPDFKKPDQIFAQRLAPDGLSLTGERVALLRNDAQWEGDVIEAPTMVRTPAGYELFFSANDYGWQPDQRASAYATGYAICRGPMGPCTDAPDNPILYSRIGANGCLSGPGGQAIFQSGNATYIAFHAWEATPGCRRMDDYRFLYVAPLTWSGTSPQIGESLRPSGGH
jgi:beta-xylosidase